MVQSLTQGTSLAQVVFDPEVSQANKNEAFWRDQARTQGLQSDGPFEDVVEALRQNVINNTRNCARIEIVIENANRIAQTALDSVQRPDPELGLGGLGVPQDIGRIHQNSLEA